MKEVENNTAVRDECVIQEQSPDLDPSKNQNETRSKGIVLPLHDQGERSFAVYPFLCLPSSSQTKVHSSSVAQLIVERRRNQVGAEQDDRGPRPMIEGWGGGQLLSGISSNVIPGILAIRKRSREQDYS